MSKPPLNKVWGLWKQGALLVEQAIGYILQLLLDQQHDLRSVRRDVDRLIVHTKLPLDASHRDREDTPDA